MKKLNIYIICAIFSFLCYSCNEEPFSYGGEGKVVLNTSINSKMEVVTRADEVALSESLIVWISNEKGVVRKYDKGKIPTSPISLISDTYLAEGWAGDSVPASFEQTWYKGSQEFNVEDGKTTPVTLTCKIANVGASVKYDEDIDKFIKNYSMTIGHKGGSLVYVGLTDSEKTGYFMMPSFDKNLSYEFKGEQNDGTSFSISGEIEAVKPATEYILKVVINEKTNEVGGAVFTITIDENVMEFTEDIFLIGAPKIQGYDFDIEKLIVAEEGQVGGKTVYVSSATTLSELELESDLLRPYTENNYPDINLLGMNGDVETNLASAGINFKRDDNIDHEKETLIQINFEEKFTNNLPNGDYAIKILAKDSNGKTSVATLTLMIGEVPVITEETKEFSYTSATLVGRVEKDGVEKIGFNYRETGDSDWIFVEGTPETRSFAKGTPFTAVLTGLKEGQNYEYVAVCDDFVSTDIKNFTTLEHQQLPNAGFEDWFLYNSKVWIPDQNYTANYWDSGNHGSTLMGGIENNLTTSNTDIKHSGISSACLQTKFVGITSSLGKLAAGNIFIGKFLGRVGVSDGATGFGRPFTDTPKSVKLWVKYIPGSKTHRGSGRLMEGHDEGQIFIALTDETMDEYNNEKWPFVVNTGTKKYFDKNDSRVIAYGEKIFTEATNGEELIQIEIPIEYYRNDRPSNIIFVASSSRYGDYFEGYDDSTMWLDDIELIYED